MSRRTSTARPTPRSGVLAELARRARHPLLLVNDSDIQVEPGYLRAVTAPLADPASAWSPACTAPRPESWASRWEALGIATEFAPSVLVARLLGAGGIRARLDHGACAPRRCARSAASKPLPTTWPTITSWAAASARPGYRIEFAPVVVETDLGRGIVAARPGATRCAGRAPSACRAPAATSATRSRTPRVWALVAFAAGQWWAGARALALRMAAGVLVGAGVLQDRYACRAILADPAARPVRLRGVAGRRLRRHGVLARPQSETAAQRQNRGAAVSLRAGLVQIDEGLAEGGRETIRAYGEVGVTKRQSGD